MGDNLLGTIQKQGRHSICAIGMSVISRAAHPHTGEQHRGPRHCRMSCDQAPTGRRGNDIIGASAIAECRRLGIDCPRQVSITGFGDWDLARLISPALTTIHSDAVRIGNLTADNLLSQIQGHTLEHQQLEYEPELAIRESTGAI